METKREPRSLDLREEDFEEKVLAYSRQRPVLVDFWAAWCAPCRLLAPILEKLADEREGDFLLVRVNVEEAPNVSSRFGVRSIPLVVLFRDGQAVDSFMGAIPEEEIRRFLGRHLSTAADEKVLEARDLLDSGNVKGAQEGLEAVLRESPNHPGALLEMARLCCSQGEDEQVLEWLGRIDPLAVEAAQGESLKVRVSFKRRCREPGDEESDLSVRYRRGCCLAAEEHYAEALETFLNIVAESRSFNDDASRKAMVDIFKIVGERSELSREYRRRLARTIF